MLMACFVDLASPKNRLAKSASSELRLSVWMDDVYNFMRSQKRRRLLSSDVTQDFDAMR